MLDWLRRHKLFFFRVLPAATSLVIFFMALSFLLLQRHASKENKGSVDSQNRKNNGQILHVLSYSAFIGSWGPGPEIAKQFKAATGITVQFLNAGDAGLLLKKLELFPADVVAGLDGLSLGLARNSAKWRPLKGVIPEGRPWAEPEFAPFDWAPMAFIYRSGEVLPPLSLNDLHDQRYRGKIALEDPRTSTPGAQFFFWILDEFGIDEGFKFFEKLRPNIKLVGASWSQAYGAFTKKQAMLAFSYLTSPVYHWTEEKDMTYQPAVFSTGHPVQIEYAAIAESCENCEAAEKFIQFLLATETQKLLMQKNYMFPVDSSAAKGTSFADLSLLDVRVREWRNLPFLLERRDQLFERWRNLGL